MEESVREMGEQPISAILKELGLDAHDLVEASEVQMTHKMVARAVKGRRLTANSMRIVRNALVKASGREYSLADLFTYAPLK